jgi:putative tryptophan/tyrosine transport system substrate-binding protein
VKRREFIAALGGVVAWPLAAHAQQSVKAAKNPRIGVLWHAGSAEEEEVYLSVVRKAFNDLGIELLHRFPALLVMRYQPRLIGFDCDGLRSCTPQLR